MFSTTRPNSASSPQRGHLLVGGPVAHDVLYNQAQLSLLPSAGPLLVGGPFAHDVLLAHAEVGDLDVSLGVQHHVVQLQVSAAHETSVYTSVCIIFSTY